MQIFEIFVSRDCYHSFPEETMTTLTALSYCPWVVSFRLQTGTLEPEPTSK